MIGKWYLDRPAGAAQRSPRRATPLCARSQPRAMSDTTTEESTLAPEAARRAHYVTLAIIALLVLGMELFARQVRSFQKVPLSVPDRAPNVIGFSDNLSLVPPAPSSARPAVLLLGSSQSYASSSTEPNGNGFGDQAGTLIDWIATSVGSTNVDYLRFASGSILPNEMMIAEAKLEVLGYRPRVVILPLIWTNIAIDRDYRPAFREALQSSQVASLVDERLKLGGASPDMLLSFRTEAAHAAANAQWNGPRPLGDLLDDRLTTWARPHVGIIGRREDLQAGFHERVLHQIVGRLAPTAIVTRPAHEANLRFNIEVMRTFVSSLVKSKIGVLVYRAPQRTNIPVPVDVSRSDEFLLPLMEELSANGAVVVDARAAVPDSLFGWTGPTKDFNHFVKDGHRALAEYIVREGRARGVFAALDPAGPSSQSAAPGGE